MIMIVVSVFSARNWIILSLGIAREQREILYPQDRCDLRITATSAVSYENKAPYIDISGYSSCFAT